MLKKATSWLSPEGRAFRRFLASLPIDPDMMERPVAQPEARDFIICGSSRSGTTLAAAMLFQPPRVVTAMEMWDAMRMPPADLFASLRQEIATGVLRRGRLNVHALLESAVVEWVKDGDAAVDVRVPADILVGVKWPAFWRYLELLPDTKFVVCLRHPVEVISSYRKTGGRLQQGLDYDTAFNRRMNAELRAATNDLALRRVMLYDYVHERILPWLDKPNVFALRYERWFDDPEGLMRDLSAFLQVELGPGPATIRPTKRDASENDAEAGFIRAHCRTAGPLGYDLSQ